MVDLKVMHINFQKDRMKTVGGIPPDGWTDRRTDRGTDGRTDRRTEKAITICPSIFNGGHDKVLCVQMLSKEHRNLLL